MLSVRDGSVRDYVLQVEGLFSTPRKHHGRPIGSPLKWSGASSKVTSSFIAVTASGKSAQ